MKRLMIFCCGLSLMAACTEDFLDVKRDKRQVIPTTIAHQQALLDNATTMNMSGSLGLNVVGGEEYSVTGGVWELLSSSMQRNAYVWAKEVFAGEGSDDWNRAYARVLYANLALEGLEKIVPSAQERKAWNEARGGALFYRALSFYELAQTFCGPFVAASAGQDPGIPLRLESDVTVGVKRNSVQEVYEQIRKDLVTAAALLPLHGEIKFRPGRAAAWALLARTCLQVGDNAGAAAYADSCMAGAGTLVDYNALDGGLRYTFSEMRYGEGNAEVLFLELIPGMTVVNASRFMVSPELYALYEEDDLRGELFFYPTRGTYTFKGSYSGTYAFFSGMALNEVYLIAAEAKVRMGDLAGGLSDLNALLVRRYRAGTYRDFEAADRLAALQKIRRERRKELLCRGLRWEDLRRFNKEEGLKETLVRELNGETFRLEPASRRYIWPIPDEVISASGMAQNPR